jgi:hypothetical protein
MSTFESMFPSLDGGEQDETLKQELLSNIIDNHIANAIEAGITYIPKGKGDNVSLFAKSPHGNQLVLKRVSPDKKTKLDLDIGYFAPGEGFIFYPELVNTKYEHVAHNIAIEQRDLTIEAFNFDSNFSNQRMDFVNPAIADMHLEQNARLNNGFMHELLYEHNTQQMRSYQSGLETDDATRASLVLLPRVHGGNMTTNHYLAVKLKGAYTLMNDVYKNRMNEKVIKFAERDLDSDSPLDFLPIDNLVSTDSLAILNDMVEDILVLEYQMQLEGLNFDSTSLSLLVGPSYGPGKIS